MEQLRLSDRVPVDYVPHAHWTCLCDGCSETVYIPPEYVDGVDSYGETHSITQSAQNVRHTFRCPEHGVIDDPPTVSP